MSFWISSLKDMPALFAGMTPV